MTHPKQITILYCGRDVLRNVILCLSLLACLHDQNKSGFEGPAFF